MEGDVSVSQAIIRQVALPRTKLEQDDWQYTNTQEVIDDLKACLRDLNNKFVPTEIPF